MTPATQRSVCRGIVAGLLCCGLASCKDEGPAAPLRPFAPQPEAANYIHNTAPDGCSTAWLTAPPCLLDDVAAAWEGDPASNYEIVDAVTPTGRGETLSAKYRRIGSTDVNSPRCWRIYGARMFDRQVKVVGRNVDCTFSYFEFTSVAPLPVPKILEFERPDTISCQIYTECPGPFRIVLDLEGSGWYGGDETLIYVENSVGTRWKRTNAVRTVNGTTVELSFSELYWPGEGSRILIKYHPWGGGRTEDVTSIYLPFDAPSAELTLVADPTEITAEGTPVTFTASAPSAAVIETPAWTYGPDDETVPPTIACITGENPCILPVYDSGTMWVTARVDGREQEAAAHVQLHVCPPDPGITDSTVVEGLRELWYHSYPDSAVDFRRERMGWLVEVSGHYEFHWIPLLADACSIQDGLPPDSAPRNALAVVHTHPLPRGTSTASCVYRGNVPAGEGPSETDLKYRSDISASLGREIPGYILDHRGLTRFDGANPAGKLFEKCNAWKHGEPIFTGE